MKKNNVIVLAIVVLASAFLLWLWYYLGLNRVDEPLDLILSIIWWVMVAVAIITFIQIEKRRKERIRTVYVAEGEIFNSEKGRVSVSGPMSLVDTIDGVLKNLKYDFTKNDLPDKSYFSTRYLVRTSKRKDDTWEGEVVSVFARREVAFKNREELAQILSEGISTKQDFAAPTPLGTVG